MLVRESTTCKACALNSFCFAVPHLEPSMYLGLFPTRTHQVRYIADYCQRGSRAQDSAHLNVEGYRQVILLHLPVAICKVLARLCCVGVVCAKALDRLRERNAHEFLCIFELLLQASTDAKSLAYEKHHSTPSLQAFMGLACLALSATC